MPSRLKASNNWVAEKLRQLLNREQARRFRENMIQQRMRVAGFGAACGYHGVAEEIKLVHGYRERDLQDGISPWEALDIERLDLLRTCIGSPFKGAMRFDAVRIADALSSPVVSPPPATTSKASFPEYVLDRSKKLQLSDAQLPYLAHLAGSRIRFPNSTPEVRKVGYRFGQLGEHRTSSSVRGISQFPPNPLSSTKTTKPW